MEGAYRAAKAIEVSHRVGVNYRRFQELLQNLSTEVSIASDRATHEREKEITQKYLEAISMYRDSLSLWEMKIDAAGHPGLTLKEGYLQLEFYSVSKFIGKYSNKSPPMSE